MRGVFLFLGVSFLKPSQSRIGQETNMDNLRANGIYAVNTIPDEGKESNGYPTNLPVQDNCLIVVIAPNNADLLQIVSYDSSLYVRIRLANVGWIAWYKVN